MKRLLLLFCMSGCASSDPPTNNTPAAVATVTVTTAPPTIAIGGTIQLAVLLQDASGNTLTGRTVTYASSNNAVATVTATGGLVSGIAAGTATITATSESQTDDIVITVQAGPVSAAECATPGTGWIFCDDFEVDRAADYFEINNAGGLFVRQASVGLNNSYGLRARFNQGTVVAGSRGIAFGVTPDAYLNPVDAGTTKYREIYWRHWIRLQPGWTGGGGDKMTRASSFVTANWAQAMVGHVWSGSNASFHDYPVIDPASGTNASGTVQTTTYNDFNNFRWLGLVQGTLPMYSSANAGTWFCVEAHIKLNDAGQSNGVMEMWINGQLQASKTGMNWVGNYSAYGINILLVENYWNNGSPVQQERYWDNLVISTQRINC